MYDMEIMIDVVLANYNHANTINTAIDALNNQTLKPNKIYIIDDASTDDSWSKLILASEKHTNLVLLKNLVNEGANKCYNKGLEFCTSDQIYFAAADDITCPELFEKCIKALTSNPEAAFATAEAIVFDADKKTFSMRPVIQPKIIGKLMTPENVRREFMSNDNWIMTGACVYRTKFVKDASGLNIKLGAFSDSILAKKLAFRYGCIFLKYTGIRWNITKSGFSRSLYNDNNEFTKLKSELQLFIQSNKEFPMWYWEKFSKHLAFNQMRLGLLNNENWLENFNKNFPKIISLSHCAYVKNKKSFRSMILIITFIKFRPYKISRILYTYLLRFRDKQI